MTKAEKDYLVEKAREGGMRFDTFSEPPRPWSDRVDWIIKKWPEFSELDSRPDPQFQPRP